MFKKASLLKEAVLKVYISETTRLSKVDETFVHLRPQQVNLQTNSTGDVVTEQ